jgi:nitroreductase
MLDAIANRASCRAYKPDPVPDEMVDELTRAALSAPSANNARPWHLIVVKDQRARQTLATVHRYASFCADSPVVLVVCGDESKSSHWWIEDCSAAIENVLIQATAMGLGTCWVGIRGSDDRGLEREQRVRNLLGIPEHIRVSALISVGFPLAPPPPKEPGPMSQVHHEAW